MTKRTIIRDPDEVRRKLYQEIDPAALSAIWGALDLLSNSGIDIGPKATEMLAERQAIKERCPKSTDTPS